MQNNKPTLANRAEIANAIRQLSEQDLQYLNRMIVERLKLISQARSTAMLSNFNVGDRVSFSSSAGEKLSGVIIRINKKTVSIVTNEGGQWNVHPSFLTSEGLDAESTSDIERLESENMPQ